jgi:hypothetical protein
MTTQRDIELSLVERVERALVLLAYFVELDGDVHLPLFEKLEAELEELKRKEGAKDRARRLLLSYSRDGGVKAIDSKNLSLSSNFGPLPYLGLPVR